MKIKYSGHENNNQQDSFRMYSAPVQRQDKMQSESETEEERWQKKTVIYKNNVCFSTAQGNDLHSLKAITSNSLLDISVGGILGGIIWKPFYY